MVYYGTGESIGNSANAAGATFLGQGIWQSTDRGQNWTQIPSTASVQEEFDSPFDIIFKIAVHPITGDLYAATGGAIRRFDGATWTLELDARGNFFSDLVITSTGIVYGAFSGSSDNSNGVWQSSNGLRPYNRIGSNTSPGFGSNGRMVLASASSDENVLYAFHTTDQTIEAGLWQWNDENNTWIDRTSTLPDEPNPNPGSSNTVDDLEGNDPIAVQGGYDLVVNVKPDDENFVVIGGTNAYKIENITTDATFTRIGGYRNNQSFASYNLGANGDEHHPDIHALEFDPNNPDVLFSGTDGGVHRTNEVTVTTVAWTNLNNNYQTYQFYHVATDPEASSDIVIGGAQDNGTAAGGFETSPDLSTMNSVFGGDGVAVAISRDNACIPFFLGVQNGPIFRDCPNAGEITPNEAQSRFVTYFYLDESNNNALYYAGRNTLFSTAESSQVTSDTWRNLGTLPGTEEIRQMVANRGTYNPAQSYLLIGGNQGSLYRLNDPQNVTNLTSLRDIGPANQSSGTVSGIAVHPTNNDIAMVTYSNYGLINIFITTNATSNNPTWNVVERNLSAFSIRSAAITEIDNETIYFVGTGRGLYSSSNPLTTDWEIEAPDQIGFAVVSALAYKPSNNKLLVGTHGNGIYEGTIENTLSVNEFNTSDTDLIAWPVPAENVLNIVVENTFVEGDLDYNLYSINGQIVNNGVLNNSKQIDVSFLSQGNYILQLSSTSRQKTIIFNKK